MPVDTSDAEFAAVLQTHLHGSFALSRECARGMVERRRGSIVMVLSMAALFGIPHVVGYSAAKTALLGLTRALAVELGPSGVRVSAIAPGWIHTDMTDPLRPMHPLLEAQPPLRRLGDPDDIAWAAVYLASDEAKFVTGQTLSPNGGWHMSQ